MASATLFSVTGCSDSEDDELAPITAAFVAPLSGPSETSGRELRNAAELALEQERNDGNPIAERFSFRFVDSQSEPEVARVDYEAAIADESVQFAFLNWHSNVALELSQLAADARFPHLFALGATNELNQQFEADMDRYAGIWLKAWPSPELLSVNYITAIEEAAAGGTFNAGGKTAVVYGEDTSWGRTFGAAIRSQLEGEGWTVVEELYVPSDALDYTGSLEAVVTAQPQLLAGTIATASIYNWIQQARAEFDAASVAQPLIVADGLGWNGDWFETLGETSNGVVDQIPQFVSSEALAFRDAYEAQYGEAPSPSAAGLAYDYTKWMFQILAEVEATQGEITRESILAVSRDMLMTGQITYEAGILMESYRYSSDSWPDPVVGGDAFTFPVLQYADGESVVVFPESLAGGNAIAN
ncbi:MAG: ABC transporter substrate-binding protein [Myxococcota bacterium]